MPDIKLTEVEIDHLLTLLLDAEREGSYYGNKARYWERHERITRKLNTATPATKE